MLSKIKSPSLVERHSPLAHQQHLRQQQQQQAAALQEAASETDAEQLLQDVQSERDEDEEQAERHSEGHAEAEREAAELVIDQQRSPATPAELDREQDDNNNQDQINNNNNNHPEETDQEASEQQQQQQQGKQSQNELLDIIELSRKGRLSKDSADSLTSFIRWSFSHFEPGRLGRLKALAAGRQLNGVGRETLDEEAGSDLDENQAENNNNNNNNNNDSINNNNNNINNNNQEDEDEREASPSGKGGEAQQVEAEKTSKYANERVLRTRAAKLGAGGRQQQQQQQATTGRTPERPSSVVQQQQQQQPMKTYDSGAPIKRSRLAIANSYSPEPASKHFVGLSASAAAELQNGGRHKFASAQLGNVVDRLHQRQDQHQLRNGASARAAAVAANERLLASAADEQLLLEEQLAEQRPRLDGTPGGLSLQLQQFLQQQQQLEQQQQQQLDKLDDLAGLGLGAQGQQRQQLALAAAIHRALMGQEGKSLGGQQNNLISSTTSATSATTTSNNGASFANSLADSLGRHQQQQRQQQPTSTTAPTTAPAQRAYNTRHAGLAQAAASLASNRLQQHQQHLATASINADGQRAAAAAAALQQQQQQQQARHAQAAAALSALANGAHPAAALHHFAAAAAAAAGQHHSPLAGVPVGTAATAALLHQQRHQQQQQQQQHHHQHQLVAAAAARHQLAGLPLASALANQTDFKCDTCPSSFDDRHRLMQHQSIHLELKKDWFTETPVEEVMRIFNRRRGEFLCNMCNLRFEATLDYDQHNHTVHGPRPYCCQFCGNGTRTFKCWRQYLNHLYDHRYIFSCTIGDCDFTVNRRDSLRFHIFRFHLNCQLPQNLAGGGAGGHQKIQTSPFNLSQSASANGRPFQVGARSNWPSHLDDDNDELDDDMDDDVGAINERRLDHDDPDEDTENEMNVAD